MRKRLIDCFSDVTHCSVFKVSVCLKCRRAFHTQRRRDQSTSHQSRYLSRHTSVASSNAPSQVCGFSSLTAPHVRGFSIVKRCSQSTLPSISSFSSLVRLVSSEVQNRSQTRPSSTQRPVTASTSFRFRPHQSIQVHDSQLDYRVSFGILTL